MHTEDESTPNCVWTSTSPPRVVSTSEIQHTVSSSYFDGIAETADAVYLGRANKKGVARMRKMVAPNGDVTFDSPALWFTAQASEVGNLGIIGDNLLAALADGHTLLIIDTATCTEKQRIRLLA